MKLVSRILLLLFLFSFVLSKPNVDIQRHFFNTIISKVSFCGASDPQTETLVVMTIDGGVFHYQNQTWHNLTYFTSQNNISWNRNEPIQSLVMSEADDNLLVLVGESGKGLVSEDCGVTYRLIHGIESSIKGVKFHPLERNWMMAAVLEDCAPLEKKENDEREPCPQKDKEKSKGKSLYVSKNLGKSWIKTIDNIHEFEWGVKPLTEKLRESLGQIAENRENPQESDDFKASNEFMKILSQIPMERIIVSREMNQKAQKEEYGFILKAILVSDDFFDSFKIISSNSKKFLLTKNFLFVAKPSESLNEAVELLVASSQSKYYELHPTELPFRSMDEYSYTVLDTFENQVFLNVNHFQELNDDRISGNLYISDSKGSAFTLSLENCVRNEEGLVDFKRVKSLEGVYIVNVYENEVMDVYRQSVFDETEGIQGIGQMTKPEQLTSKIGQGLKNYKQTMITFDKGGKWERIKAPRVNGEGENYDCEDECFLNLHSISSGEMISEISTTVNSRGIIIGTGNVGAYLSNDDENTRVFMSRDGGLNWYEIAKGPHVYGISDHGGLIVTALSWKATNFVQFSWNEGKSWEKLSFANLGIEAENVVVEPTNTAQKLIVFGETVSASPKGALVVLDFSELHQRQCTGQNNPDSQESDYETWTPHTYTNDKCLMGRRIEYIRRKQEAQCFNGLSLEMPTFEEACLCTQEDFECDLYFTRSGNEGECELIDSSFEALIKKVPSNCQGTYDVSNGYRKIAGNSCEGGLKYEEVFQVCPGNSLVPIVSCVLIVLGLGICLYSHGPRILIASYNYIEQLIHSLVLSAFSKQLQPELPIQKDNYNSAYLDESFDRNGSLLNGNSIHQASLDISKQFSSSRLFSEKDEEPLFGDNEESEINMVVDRSNWEIPT